MTALLGFFDRAERDDFIGLALAAFDALDALERRRILGALRDNPKSLASLDPECRYYVCGECGGD